MSQIEEKLREASCVGDEELVQNLLAQNVNVNSQNAVNGWTPLHWAAKRGHLNIVKQLLTFGANPDIQCQNGLKPVDVCSNSTITSLLGENPDNMSSGSISEDSGSKFTPNYIKNAPLNGGQSDFIPRIRSRHSDIAGLPTTMLPSQSDDLVLRVRIANSNDPDFIEIEVPTWKLTYASLLKICCEELEIKESQVERIRKLPNTKLRKDSDVKRLTQMTSLEVVLKISESEHSNVFVGSWPVRNDS